MHLCAINVILNTYISRKIIVVLRVKFCSYENIQYIFGFEIGATVIPLQNLRECTIGVKRKGVQEPVRCRHGTRMRDLCTDLINNSIVSNACI